MGEKNKFDLYDSELYDSDEYEISWKEEDNDVETPIESINDTKIASPQTEEIKPVSEEVTHWFDLEWGDTMDIDEELNKNNEMLNKSIDKNLKKKIIIVSLSIFLFLLIIIWIFSILNKSDKKVRKIITTDTIENTSSNSDNQKLINNDIIEEVDTEDSLTYDVASENDTFDNNTISSWTTIEANSWNNIIVVNNNSWDDVMDITEAILSPSDIKITINKLWEFDWVEENTDWNTSFIKIKENSLIIPTVSKNNFVPKLEIEVLNIKTDYSTSDLILIEFNVLLNSKTLSYTITKKIYKDKDFIIDLTLNSISSDIVSIEENLIKEELTIPINLMYKWKHTVWFKINNYPVQNFKYNIR